MLACKARTLDELSQAAFVDDGVSSSRFAAAYCISKLLLNRATQIQAADKQLQERGITVNTVCPGWCDTELGWKAISNRDKRGP